MQQVSPGIAAQSAAYSTPRDLSVLFNRLIELERLATTQEWWLFGRVLPEARRIAELTSLIAAARADLAGLLRTLGYPQPTTLDHPGTSELAFQQGFATDTGWALAHRDEAVSILRLAAMAMPVLLVQTTRIANQLGDNTASAMVRRVLARVTERLSEARSLAMAA